MLPDVPASLDALLVLLRPCFTHPTVQTFRGLLVGQTCQTQQRTVTGMLVGARLRGCQGYGITPAICDSGSSTVQKPGGLR